MLERSLTPRSRCAAPGLPWPYPFPVLVGRDSWELPDFGSLLPPLAEFGQQGRCSHKAWLAGTCQDVGFSSLLAQCPLLCACLCSCDRHLTETETQGTWLLGTCQWVAVLRIRLDYLKSSCAGDVNRNKRLNGRSGSFTHLGKTFINYYLKACAFLKIHCILPSLACLSDKWKAELDVDYTKIKKKKIKSIHSMLLRSWDF